MVGIVLNASCDNNCFGDAVEVIKLTVLVAKIMTMKRKVAMMDVMAPDRMEGKRLEMGMELVLIPTADGSKPTLMFKCLALMGVVVVVVAASCDGSR